MRSASIILLLISQQQIRATAPPPPRATYLPPSPATYPPGWNPWRTVSPTSGTMSPYRWTQTPPYRPRTPYPYPPSPYADLPPEDSSGGGEGVSPFLIAGSIVGGLLLVGGLVAAVVISQSQGSAADPAVGTGVGIPENVFGDTAGQDVVLNECAEEMGAWVAME